MYIVNLSYSVVITDGGIITNKYTPINILLFIIIIIKVLQQFLWSFVHYVCARTPKKQQRSILTAKIWAVTEWRSDDAIWHDDIDNALLDEEHAITERPFLDDGVAGLEDLELEKRDHTGHEVGVGADEERDAGDEFATVVVCDILWIKTKCKRKHH